MSLTRQCASQFENRVRTRGRAYAVADAVHIAHVGNDGLDAEVYGTAADPYGVKIDWYDVENGILRSGCTCASFREGHLCKHIWATLLTVEEMSFLELPDDQRLSVERLDDDARYEDEIDFGAVPESELDEDDYDERPAGRLDRHRQTINPLFDDRSPAKASASRTPKQAQQAWTLPLRELHRRVFAEQVIKTPGYTTHRCCRAWYVLDVNGSLAKSELILDLFYQEKKKNGEYGKIKRLSFDNRVLEFFEDPTDREILPQLAACAKNDAQNGYATYFREPKLLNTLQLPAAMFRLLLPKLAATGRFRWMLDTTKSFDKSHAIAWDGDNPWEFRFNVIANDSAQQWRLVGEFFRGEETLRLQDIICVAPDGLLLTPTHLSYICSDVPTAWIRWGMKHTCIDVPFAQRDTFLKLILEAPKLPTVVWPENLALEQITAPPRPCLRILEPKHPGPHRLMTGTVAFLYGTAEVALADVVSGVTEQDGKDGSVARIHTRDFASEEEQLRQLTSISTVRFGQYGVRGGVVEFKRQVLPDLVNQLLAAGWRVEAEGKQFRAPGEFQISVQSGIDWFDLDATIDFGGVTAQLPDLLHAARKGETYVALGDGSRGILPEDWLQQYTGLAELGKTTDGKVRFQRSQALLLDALLAQQHNLRVDQNFQELRERLQSVEGVAPRNAPGSFQGTLREYQRDGLGWFQFLDDLGVGGCLADDMGLGKTIQVLALLESHRTRHTPDSAKTPPSLVIVPKSLVFNWIDEATRFTPQLNVLNYTGMARKQLVDELDDAHLILTTYGTLRRDIVELKDRHFNFVILDEAQAIKNHNSQAAKASLLLQAQRRLALTGTPIENHLGELWSLFEFLNPGMLGRSRAFNAVCKNARKDDGQSLSELSRAIAPFVLRRTKQQVLTELPEKTEQTIYCELSPKERKAYDELRDFYRLKLSKVIDQKGLQRAKIHVLEALLRLRQAACHRGLIDATKSKDSSAKIDTLLEQLEEIIGEGHKALVFSQFTSLLSIVRQRLDSLSIRYEYLDGKTRNRKEIVDRFQQRDGCEVFLISLKAGGQGLNLTEADYVFILDPWWNPAVEMQAIDRVHRIGQTQPVFAYRLIARDTVEEKVLELQDSKRELANAIITANDSLIRKLTAEDLQRILS